MKMSALAIGISLAAAGSAQAAPILVAGWDFSQYSIPGFLSIDLGSSLTNTLSSNYSDLDATGEAGLGTGSEFGTMHVDGLFGSFATPLDAADPFRPQTPSILLNDDMAAIAGVPMGSAAASNKLLNEVPQSQPAFSEVSMVAGGSSVLDVVFEADLGGAYLGDAWELAFAGVTLTGGSTVGVEFSTDGSNYSSVGNALLTTTAQVFSFALGGVDLGEVFVRLRFEGSETIFPAIDNLTLKAEVEPAGVAEPGTALLCIAGLAGLGAFGRRRA